MVFAGMVLMASSHRVVAQSGTERAVPTVNGSTFECTDASIEFRDSGQLTREEKIERMDQALLDSLSRFDACQNRLSGSGAATATVGGETGGDAAGGTAGESVASSDMSGEEKARPGEGAHGSTTTPLQPGELQSDYQGENLDDPPRPDDGQGGSAGQARAENGKIPEDIPPADNDSVLEGQIRQAAINETNPEIKEKLWDEYRRYKGLKTVH